jgi:hypothetical protein
MDREIVYFGNCHHYNNKPWDINSFRCLKRYIDFFDITDFKRKKLAVCNEFFRLKFIESKVDSYYSDGIIYIETIEGIFRDYGIDVHYWRRNEFGLKSLLNFKYIVSDRPYVYGKVDFEFFIENYLKFNYENQLYLKTQTVNFLNYILKYAKYKKAHKEAKKIISRGINEETIYEITNLSSYILKNQK